MEFPLIDGLDGNVALSILCEKDYEATKSNHQGAHRHSHGEFFLIRSGYLRSYTYERRWLIPAGHFCWVPPMTVHGGDTDDSLGIRLHVRAEFCRSLPSQPCVVSGTPLILAIVERLAEAGGSQKNLSVAQLRLLEVLSDEVERARTAPIVLPMPQDGKLRKIAELWLAQPDDRTGLDELAGQADMSRRSFTRNFKQNTGLSVGEWRQIARLMHGLDMLAQGKSVTETAFALGFDSISSFVALCRRHTGMSPKSMVKSATVKSDMPAGRVRPVPNAVRRLIPYS